MVVAIGGSACTDGGAGLLQALGATIGTSTGRSISTGPGRPERMMWKAFWKAIGTSAGSMMVWAHLVTGLAMEAISIAWKSSLSSLARGAWPVMQRIGMESAMAE